VLATIVLDSESGVILLCKTPRGYTPIMHSHPDMYTAQLSPIVTVLSQYIPSPELVVHSSQLVEMRRSLQST